MSIIVRHSQDFINNNRYQQIDTDLIELSGFDSNGAEDFGAKDSLTEGEEENASNGTVSTSLKLELDIRDGAFGSLSGTILSTAEVD